MATKKYKRYPQARRPFTAAEDKQIRALRKGGATGLEIATELHCHKGSVHRRLREMGLSYTGFWSKLRAKQKAKPKKRRPARRAKPKK